MTGSRWPRWLQRRRTLSDAGASSRAISTELRTGLEPVGPRTCAPSEVTGARVAAYSRPDGGPSSGDVRRPVANDQRAVRERGHSRASASERISDQFCDMLADAISSHDAPDDRLSVALRPAVERAIRTSVRSDPIFFADILYPVIGPVIRKAIAEALRAMAESFNHSLALVFSWKYVRWRFEALRSGTPFSEVVLLHTLVYRVEQVFLLHRESGLVLRHLSSQGVETRDPDLVSGMLTAIQDFVHDSFAGGEGALESFRVGELGVWIEQSPNAVLAGVVRGHAPADLCTLLRAQLERVELQLGPELAAFAGDAAPFARADALLEPCMVFAASDRA